MEKFEIWFILTIFVCSTVAAPRKKAKSHGCDGAGRCNYYVSEDLTREQNRVNSQVRTKRNTDLDDMDFSGKAEAKLFHQTTSGADDLIKVETTIGKVGVKGFPVDGFGGGIDATLAEVGGKVGKGIWSIGGKIGASADTAFSYSPAQSQVKVLGTGVSVDKKNGLSLCLFGNCVSFG